MKIYDSTMGLCCRIRELTNSSSLRGLYSSPPHRLGHAQLRHPIKHRAFYPRFRALGRQAPSTEPPAEEQLESKHDLLGDTLPRIATKY